MYKSNREVNRSFKRDCNELDFKKVNGVYKANTRMEFVVWVDHLNRVGMISDRLSRSAYLI